MYVVVKIESGAPLTTALSFATEEEAKNFIRFDAKTESRLRREKGQDLRLRFRDDGRFAFVERKHIKENHPNSRTEWRVARVL